MHLIIKIIVIVPSALSLHPQKFSVITKVIQIIKFYPIM